MALHPVFFQVPSEIDLLENNQLRVVWYAQIDNLTLVHWEISTGETSQYRPADGTEGESLFRGDTLIEWAYYEITAPASTEALLQMSAQSGDPRMRIDSNLGRNGISPSVIARLRSPENQMWIGA